MKLYEDSFRMRLPPRMPTIIRLDGRAFHSLKLEKPFDENFNHAMNEVGLYLYENIQTTVLAYIQSDEISLLLHPYKSLQSQPWFGNNIQKMTSISAGIASVQMNLVFNNRGLQFDSRVFVLPENEVCNYFIWRQQDWIRNSKQMLVRSMYSQKDLHKKNQTQMLELATKKGVNWNSLFPWNKFGRVITNGYVHSITPEFTKDRNFINKHLEIGVKDEHNSDK
jgi:tRNA(His) 5'-end guanylyltransferase